MKKLQTEFIKGTEVTEEKYYDMLGCLPPEEMCGNAFLVGEPSDHGGEGHAARFEMYFIQDRKYYSGGLATVQDFRIFMLPKEYEGPGDTQMCGGNCGTQIAVPSPGNAISRYGHGEICPECGTREAIDGDFIGDFISFYFPETAKFMAMRK